MAMYFDRKTLGILGEQFIIAAANAKDAQGLRVFVKQEHEKALSIVTTALAQYVGDDVMLLGGTDI